MSLEDAMRQKTGQLVLPLDGRGEAPRCRRSGEASTAASGNERPGTDRLIEEMVQRDNAKAALKRVKQNKGSSGIDGMTVDALSDHLVENWIEIREQLLAGTYQPKPVRRQEIPKSGGGVRELGIPTALDRFVQQLILQVLQPRFDPTFSEHSHGFRPGRRAHDAVCEAQRYIQDGRRVVVDVDLEKFFDRVNHDVLEAKSAVARPQDRKFLGYSFWVASGRVVKRRVAPKALEAMKDRVREITARTGGRSMQAVAAELRSYLAGWKQYFRLAETPRVLSDLDEWIRHRMRLVQLKQWKRGPTVYRELRARGMSSDAAARVAVNARRWWRNSSLAINIALPASDYDRMGVPRLAAYLNNSNRRMRTRTSGGVGGE